ncbi:hypothetical protein ACFV8T_38675 [Streptomyces sp. NPDC059832]|uniref:hypothetical protein n=1 Tax=Streptomyces sp. NPDC059832 TaxID=3346966 RepID=UPI00365E5B16
MLYDNPDAFLICAFKHGNALCEPEPGATAPRQYACQTGCGNTVRTDVHARQIRERLTEAAAAADSGYPENEGLVIDPKTGVSTLERYRADERRPSAVKLEQVLKARLPERPTSLTWRRRRTSPTWMSTSPIWTLRTWLRQGPPSKTVRPGVRREQCCRLASCSRVQALGGSSRDNP